MILLDEGCVMCFCVIMVVVRFLCNIISHKNIYVPKWSKVVDCVTGSNAQTTWTTNNNSTTRQPNNCEAHTAFFLHCLFQLTKFTCIFFR